MSESDMITGFMPDERLLTIAQLIGDCDRFADVGCDHGRLGAYMLRKEHAHKAWLTDISEPSLKKAEKLIRRLGLEDRASFLVTDGIAALPESVDTIVIAGMGGATICGILEAGVDALHGASLILQANVGVYEVRKCLVSIGYRITDERIVKQDRRHYVIIKAEPGRSEYDETDLRVGPVLRDTDTPELRSYTAFRLRVAGKALMGANAGGREEEMRTLREEIAIWESIQERLAARD